MSEHTLLLEQPAIRWEDALPAGNGRIGAMVYGNIQRDTVLVNHEALWLPLWEKPDLPDLASHLPKYRRLLEALQFQEADRFWRGKLRAAGWPECIYTNPAHPAFDLKIEQRIDQPFTAYRRHLDFRSGEVSVEWTEGRTRFVRRLFVSRADDAIVLRIAANRPGAVDVTLELVPHPRRQDNFKKLHYPRAFAPAEIPLTCRSSATGAWLAIECRYPDGRGYGGLARVVPRGGRLCARDGRIVVSQADEVLLLLKVFHPLKASLRNLKPRVAALRPDYATLRKRHRRLHHALYARVGLDLDGGTARRDTNETLLATAYRKQAPRALIEKLFHYGRYLFVSSTHAQGWPPHLQGLWNGDYIPAWSCDYTLDENIQMHHWQALPGQLPELMQPYFNYLDRSIPDWRANARAFFGCRGVLTCLRQSDHGRMVENMPYLIWVAGAGWLGQAYYDYYLYTGDRAFLRQRAVPFLTEVARFFEDFLYEGPDGRYRVAPSMSPENIPDIPGGTRPALNATMDIFVIREALGNLCRACRVLNIARRDVARWEAMIAKLPAIDVNEDGAIKEWQHPDLKDNYRHRHLSHVYGLFPGIEITREQTPQGFEACRVAVEKRLTVGLQAQTGWSLAHLANVYARLGRGDRALECLDLLSRSCVGPNFLTCHDDVRGQGITLGDSEYRKSVFQVDANMGLTAAVFEMLLFSAPGILRVLPALPGRWQRGVLRGVLCRGGIVASLAWDRPAGRLDLRLRSRTRQTIRLKLPRWAKGVLALQDDSRIRLDTRDPRGAAVALPARKTLHLRSHESR